MQWCSKYPISERVRKHLGEIVGLSAPTGGTAPPRFRMGTMGRRKSVEGERLGREEAGRTSWRDIA
eukprot:664544-Amorphochlora_amoeboformis.AAC.2